MQSSVTSDERGSNGMQIPSLMCPKVYLPVEYSIWNEVMWAVRFLGVWSNENLLQKIKSCENGGRRGKKENQKIGRVF